MIYVKLAITPYAFSCVMFANKAKQAYMVGRCQTRPSRQTRPRTSIYVLPVILADLGCVLYTHSR